MEIKSEELPASSTRREFLKTATKTSFAVAGASVVLAGCGKKGSSSGLVRGSSPKKEILYQKTQQWDMYYSVAK